MLRLRHIWWALGITWQVSPQLTLAYFGSALTSGLLPAFQIIVSRFLINDIVLLLSNSTTQIASLIPWLILLFLLALTEIVVLLVGSRYLLKRLEDELTISIASMVMEHANKMPLHLFEDLSFQDTLERAQQNVALNFVIFLRSLVEACTGVLQIILLFAILIYLEPLMIIIALVAIPPYSAIMLTVSRRRYQNEYKRAPDRRWTRYYIDLMLDKDHTTEIRLLGIGDLIIGRFQKLLKGFAQENKAVEIRALSAGIGFALITISLFFLLFYRVLERVLVGGLTVGDVAIMGGAIARLTSASESVVAKLGLALERSMHVSNLHLFLEIPTEDTASFATPSFSNLQGRIEFRDVSFAYPDSDHDILSNISFTINPGETVALVGENGAGKSTLVKLLARVYQPKTGSIYLDDYNLQTLPISSVYHHIAFVMQNFGHYEATVSDNIAYGNPSKYLQHPAELELLAHELDIHNMIEQMPDGYDTFLGRRFGSYEPSQGQWQQLAIARVFARDATVLILDEPTANLDARTEHTVFSRFVKLSEHRSTLLISHRFTTVSMADRILVLEGGKIIEQGTHSELMENEKGSYAQLYRLHYHKMQE